MMLQIILKKWDKCGNWTFEIGTRRGISWSWYWIFWFHKKRFVLKRTNFLAFLEEINFNTLKNYYKYHLTDVQYVTKIYPQRERLVKSSCLLNITFDMGRGLEILHTCYPSRVRLKCDGTRAETRFRPSAKRTSLFKSAGTSVQSTTGSWGMRISGTNAGYTKFRGSVKCTVYPLHSPVSPSLRPPCVTVCHHVSAGLYYACSTETHVASTILLHSSSGHILETKQQLSIKCRHLSYQNIQHHIKEHCKWQSVHEAGSTDRMWTFC
jgi:hypothetical protein